MDEAEDSFRELSNSSNQQYNILCSGDKDGNICFSIFGIFPIGKMNLHNSVLPRSHANNQILNASICNVSLSKDLCHLVVMCSGDLSTSTVEAGEKHLSSYMLTGFHCLVLDTSIFCKRKNELNQVAHQASNIEDLVEVIRTSLSVMSKQWSDAMHTFTGKFNALSSLIIDHGLDSSPQEELLSLLGGARTSPAVHQFLVNTLGEAGLKRVAKVVNGAGKELQLVVRDHLQPAAEIIGFRIGELQALSKWRARYQGIGLDEKLLDNATENAGMFLMQVERFMRVLCTVAQQFSNFFSWLLKSVKILMSEQSDQLYPFSSSELVIMFLKFLYDQDPLKQLLELPEGDHVIEVDVETMQRIKELSHFGGFSDTAFLRRTLAEEFQQMECCFRDAFQMPFATISKRIQCKDLLPLFPMAATKLDSPVIPASISYYKDLHEVSGYETSRQSLIDYISFRVPDISNPNMSNCIGIIRGAIHDMGNSDHGQASLEASLLCIPNGYHCVDLSLYKDAQLILLLDQITTGSEGSGNASMMLLQAGDLPFISISRSLSLDSWIVLEIKDQLMQLELGSEKVRGIPHSVIQPFAVSASRGVACVFSARKRALVYILDEDEEDDDEDDAE
ncbi:unnamed protein product [Cuscuta campestris]|uniref:Anaphase-promoting complex subunit 4 n=1 Tax=Cuscuta campestris TaxID=132261 RepID=A0A484MLS9_9ASTE|nr:unnamed protein product [Cuscuta campestris]